MSTSIWKMKIETLKGAPWSISLPEIPVQWLWNQMTNSLLLRSHPSLVSPWLFYHWAKSNLCRSPTCQPTNKYLTTLYFKFQSAWWITHYGCHSHFPSHRINTIICSLLVTSHFLFMLCWFLTFHSRAISSSVLSPFQGVICFCLTRLATTWGWEGWVLPQGF